jgi:hypothetical protein
MLLHSDLHSAFNERRFGQTSRRLSQNTMRIQASASHRIKLNSHANVQEFVKFNVLHNLGHIP